MYKDKDKERKYHRTWAKANREKRNLYYRRWHKKNPGQRRKAMLKYNYGLTLQQFEEMLEEQKGLCSICGALLRPPCVDHNHTTKKVRALLCKFCNFAVGIYELKSKAIKAY